MHAILPMFFPASVLYYTVCMTYACMHVCMYAYRYVCMCVRYSCKGTMICMIYVHEPVGPAILDLMHTLSDKSRVLVLQLLCSNFIAI